jgi:CheY-like chemotaxis protein
LFGAHSQRFVECGDGTRGLAIEKPPAPLFLDLVMPGLSGVEVLCTLCADPQIAGTPVASKETR